jgi:hypothetical protein
MTSTHQLLTHGPRYLFPATSLQSHTVSRRWLVHMTLRHSKSQGSFRPNTNWVNVQLTCIILPHLKKR